MSSTVKKGKFKIEPFRHPLKPDPAYREKTWKILEDAVYEINNHNASGLSFEELYRNAYNMVINKHGDHLYNNLSETLRKHLVGIAEKVVAMQGVTFLKELKDRWDNHNKSMQMIRDILMYMDRIYVQRNNKAPVHQLGLDLWRDNIVRQPQIQERLLTILLEFIHRERLGEVIDRALIRSVTQMLMDLGPQVYQEDFERQFLERAAEFYQVEATEYFCTSNCPDFLKKAERRLAEEKERVGNYLDPSSEPKITRVLEKELISKQMHGLVEMENSGLVSLLRDDKLRDLARMHSLLKRVDGGLELMRKTMGKFLRESGKALVTDQERCKDPVEFVHTLLGEKSKYDRIILEAFGNDKTFQNAMNTAFEYFINLGQRTPEYISLYMDDRLRKGVKGMSAEDDLESTLDRVMLLFRYISEKDIFEKYYKQHLSKRLLSGKAVSDDGERSVLMKLKTECGYQFTSKLESMFTDIKTSQDMMQEYKAAAHASGGPDGDIVVQLLTTGSWPSESGGNCILPNEAMELCNAFQEFYARTHQNRKLIWQTNKGHADLKATFGDKKKELNVNTQQMCILMLYNDADTYTFKELKEELNIANDGELKRSLQSLACQKGKNILRKEPVSRDVNENDTFHFNDKFQSKQVKVKIGTIMAQKETEPERQETRQKLEQDRNQVIDASIVRLMKSRKRLDHNSIVAEVTQQLASRFNPAPAAIKKRIETLLERDYLSRDEDDRRIYFYVA